jgi:GH43 family beta-xylosidase
MTAFPTMKKGPPDDTFTVDEDSSNNVLAVLSNDSDIDGDPLAVVAVGTPNQGRNGQL